MIARLGVLLGLDTAEFNKGLADSSQKLDAFVNGVSRAATVATAAFAAMTVKAMMFSDEIADVAQANDVAIDTVVKLQNALANAGGKADNASKMFSSFTSYVDKAAEGSFEAQQQFAKIGVSLRDLAYLSTQDLFYKTVEGISKIEDPLTRSAKAMELFGKAAKGVDFVGVAEGMKNGADVTDRQANAIKLLAEFYDRLGQASRDSMLNFVNFVEPALRKINDLLETMSRLSKEGNVVNGFLSILGDDFKNARIQATLEEIERLNAKIANPLVGEFWKSGYRQELAEAKKLLAELGGETKKAFQADVRRADAAIGSGTAVVANAAAAAGGPLRAVKPGIDKEKEAEEKRRSAMMVQAKRARMQELEEVESVNAAYARQISNIMDYQAAQERRLLVDQKVVDLDEKKRFMLDAEYEQQRNLIELEYQHKEALEALNKAQLSPADREGRIAAQNELYAKQVALINRIKDIEDKRRTGDISKGFMDAAKEFFIKLPTDVETGAAMFGSMMGNMQSALDNFVRTGKLNFKDFARSVIQDLIAIQLKAQAMKMFANLLGFSAGPQTGTTVPVADIPLPGRAEGGAVAGGAVYMVGERGPELFVPRMSGSIIPNKALGAMGNTTNVTNYNINAIDVKSFEERIMGSSNAVWAANLYAQKRLPIGAGRM